MSSNIFKTQVKSFLSLLLVLHFLLASSTATAWFYLMLALLCSVVGFFAECVRRKRVITFPLARPWRPRDRWRHPMNFAWHGWSFRAPTGFRPNSWCPTHFVGWWRPAVALNGCNQKRKKVWSTAEAVIFLLLLSVACALCILEGWGILQWTFFERINFN